MKLLHSNRFWIITIAALLAASLAASYFVLTQQSKAPVARVYIDGVPVREIDLAAVTEPYTFTLQTGGGENELLVEHGRIRMYTADCPDKTCVRQGWIANGLVPIVCLPHKIVIRIEEAPHHNAPFDAVTQ